MYREIDNTDPFLQDGQVIEVSETKPHHNGNLTMSFSLRYNAIKSMGRPKNANKDNP